MKPNEVTQSRFVDCDMLMWFYLGYAVRHTYTHSVHPIKTTRVITEYEDVDIVLAPSDCGNGGGSSSGSEGDYELTSINLDAMDMDKDGDEGEGDEDAAIDNE